MRSLSIGRVLPLVVLASVLMLSLACGDGDDTFKIGVMESVTGPGETYGNVAVQAKQMAVDEINAAGGINGRMMELDRRRLQVQRPGRHHRIQQADRR